MEQGTRVVAGVRVHTTGTSGVPLVVLHANGGDHRDFDAVAAHWATDHVVHAVDWPGHGADPLDGRSSAVGFAEVLPAVLAGLGGPPPVLVGNSVGGFAALRCAARHPDLVGGLVLVSPGGFTYRTPFTWVACRALGTGPGARLGMRLLPRLYLSGRGPEVLALLDRAAVAARDDRAVAVYASLWRSFLDRDHDATGDAVAVRCPTLLVWGRRDPVLPWLLDGRRARRRLPDAEVVTLRAGHQPFVEAPDEFTAAVAPFLHRVGTAA